MAPTRPVGRGGYAARDHGGPAMLLRDRIGARGQAPVGTSSAARVRSSADPAAHRLALVVMAALGATLVVSQ